MKSQSCTFCSLRVLHDHILFSASNSSASPSMIIFYFLLLIPQVTSLSFNLCTIDTRQKNVINMYQDAFISADGIQLTSDSVNNNLSDRVGKATYVELLHLWDKSSRELTKFSTHFTFVIRSKEPIGYADGLTFFLAPNGSDIASGGAMGLPVSVVNKTSRPKSPFVAVEFDTYTNPDWDPKDVNPTHTHAGISINSLKSNVTALWYANISAGITNECWINYDSWSKNLSVVFTGSRNGINITGSLYLVVDLREILPENVSFGFSAATGSDFETHTIKSWDFTSSLEIENPITPPTGQPEPNITPRKKKKAPVLIIGLAICSCVLVGGLAFLGLFFWRRRQQRRNNEEDDDGDAFEHDLTMEIELEMDSGPKKFSYSEISLATNDFSEDQILGKGGFGGVCRGFVKESNSDIAVKRISKESKHFQKQRAIN